MKHKAWAAAVLTALCACGGMSAEFVHTGKKSAPLDVIYVTHSARHGETPDEGTGELAESLVFALAKRGFKAASFNDRGERAEGYRHHAVLSVFQNLPEDILGRRGSLTVHVRIIDARSGETVSMIRMQCDGCALRDGGSTMRVAERLAAGIDEASRK
ncbi:MAG: hypothetical protein EPN93_01955 [Spirochaetes bacterium]|nr:MAG: hypothetical protein EPN93_01955 [Spirochaetota bacterium]